jgi:hypothetical protein
MECAMGLDVTAYSHITLLEILQDEQAWQQKDDDAPDPDAPLVFLSTDLPFPERLTPLVGSGLN